jgi:hypothetical protein
VLGGRLVLTTAFQHGIFYHEKNTLHVVNNYIFGYVFVLCYDGYANNMGAAVSFIFTVPKLFGGCFDF